MSGLATRLLPRRSYVGLELGLSRSTLVVTEVDDASPAQKADLREGDALHTVAGRPVDQLAEVRRAMGRLPTDRPSVLGVRRDGRSLEVAVHARPMPVEGPPSGEVELDQVSWRGHLLRVHWGWPEGPGPHPLVWLLPGAGFWPEEHPTSPKHPHRLFNELLTAHGFATLRIERSGLGDSEGPPCTQLDLHDELEAFRLGFAQLRGHPRVRWDAVFPFGRSLGGMLAALLSRDIPVAGLGLWGTSVDPWHDALLSSSMRQLELRGLTRGQLNATRERLGALQRLIYLDGLTPAQAFQRRPDLRDVMPTVYEGDRAHGRVASYFQQLQRMDVAACIRDLAAPVLAMHGSCDWLAERHSTERIAELAGDRGTCLELPGLDHLMHRRPGLQEAFDEPWGGEFDTAAGEAFLAFMGQCLRGEPFRP